jgi:hypothetical protein
MDGIMLTVIVQIVSGIMGTFLILILLLWIIAELS